MKTVVITGASSGIGRATALAFAARGHRVVLVARDREKLARVAAEIGERASVHACDVAEDGALARAVGEVVRKFGAIDVWVNNAGVGAIGSFTDVPLETHRRVLDVNLGGYLAGAHAVLPVFAAQGHGTLINVASISAYVAQATSTAYVTSKFAIRGLVYALRQDVALAGLRRVHVCLVHPEVVSTGVFERAANFSHRRVDLGLPQVSPERVARAIVSVARRPRREAFVGFFGRFAVFGFRYFPGLGEFLMTRLAKVYYRRRGDELPESDGNLFGPAR